MCCSIPFHSAHLAPVNGGRLFPLLLGCSLSLASALGISACNSTASAHVARTDSSPSVVQRNGQIFLPPSSPLRQRIVVQPIELQTVKREILAPATVEAEPAHLAKIAPPLTGRIVKLFVRFQGAVKPGTPLFTIDSPDLVTAQSDYLKAKSAFAQAERDVSMQRDLVEHGIGAKHELEQKETQRDTAKSDIERARLRLHLLGVREGIVGGPLTVVSPIAGRIVELSTAPGQYQNDPAAVLMTVADLSTVWITANIQEKDIRRVRPGDEVAAVLAAYPGETFAGKVLFIGDLLDPDTRTVKARISFDNPQGRLKPGMYATVTFRQDGIQELVCPATAVVIAGDKSQVYVETGPWQFERRPVEVGDQVGDHVIITRGLQFGSRIVATNAVLLP
jgi:membrane fusion protein, heavy metal efflux system